MKKITSYFSVAKTLSFLTCLLCIYPSFADPQKSLDIDILQNNASKACPYMNEVLVEVKYKKKHFSEHLGYETDYAFLVVELEKPYEGYVEIYREEVETGKGSSLIQFDAGDCGISLRATIQ